jgi:hypothetical protein
MPRSEMTREELVALFAIEATAPRWARLKRGNDTGEMQLSSRNTAS